MGRDFPGGAVIQTSPSNAEGAGTIPVQGAKIPHVSQTKKKKNIKQKQYCNKFNKDFLKKWSTSKKKSLKKKKGGEMRLYINEVIIHIWHSVNLQSTKQR